MAPLSTFLLAFFVVWFMALAYVVTVLRLAGRVRELKKEGRALDAPDLFDMPVGGMYGVLWIITGRFASLGDAVVTRRATRARILLFIVFPLMLAIFAIAATMVIA